jgi:hypothetical protein
VTPYRFRRRAFVAAMSGGVGLKVMLRNLEGSAQGTRSPGRLLVTHWPVGIVAGRDDALWKPTSGSVGGSPALKPFADLGLGPDMTVIKGLTTAHLPASGGGGHESGTVTLVTGVAPGGTRRNCCQGSDAFAAGASFEQLLLDRVPALRAPGPGYANSIADSRTDFFEISTRCLSYSAKIQDVITYTGETATEAAPLLPVLSPMQQYMNLFSGFLPGTGGAGGGAGGGGAAGGGGSGGGRAPAPVADAMLKKLVGKRSVLDFAVEELNQLKRLAPSEVRSRLNVHTDAVLEAEASVVSAINARAAGGGAGGGGGATGGGGGGAGATGGDGHPGCGGTCTTPPPPPPSIIGMSDASSRGSGINYGNPTAPQDDAPIHAQVGSVHLALLKAAFICDVIRVGTYQWSPGTNHVGFALYPGTAQPYQHHPTSHRINTVNTTAAATLEELDPVSVFLYNVQLWYFARHAENLAAWKNTVDGCGNNLLDYTCIPFLTEVRATSHERSNMAAMIIGGKQLGFFHDRYVTGNFTTNQFWGTIARALGHTDTAAPFGTPVAGVLANT